MLLLQTYCIPTLFLKFCWTNKRYNFYHFINEITKLKTLKIMAYLPKSWVVLSLQAYVLLGPQNRYSPLFMAFWWIAKSFCRRKLQQHLLQLCKSALRWYISLSRTTGLSTIYRSGQISQWIFWHRNIVYLSMRHTLYFGPTLTYFSLPVHCF